MKNRLKMIIVLMVALTMVCSVSYTYATSLNDINKKIDSTEDKLEEGKDKVKDMNEDISQLQQKINSNQTGIVTLEAQIAEKEASLAAKKAEINKNTDSMNKRLRNMYKSGSVSFIDIILSSGNVGELITNMEMIKIIYKSDSDLIVALKKSYAKIKAESKELAKMKSDLEAKQQQMSADKADISRKRSAVAADNKELEQKLDSLNAEADRITADIQSLSSKDTKYSGGVLLWPCPSSHRVTSEFGYRIHPILGYRKLHTGIDIGASYGAAIVAANSGKVIASYYNSSYGNMVMIDHGGGIVTLYAHASSRLVSKGASVSRGQTIARVGSTGSSTGNHLHFEVRVNGSYKNPRSYL